MFKPSFRLLMSAAVGAAVLFGSLGAAPVEARQRDPSSPQTVAQSSGWVTLTNAAALYYLYSQHQGTSNYGPNGRYYMSDDGRVYYYNQWNRQPVWVTAPSQGVRVPYYTARTYRNYQGYNRNQNGRTLTGLRHDNWQNGHPYYSKGNNGNHYGNYKKNPGNHYGNNKPNNNGNYNNGNSNNNGNNRNNGNGNKGKNKGH